MNGLDPTVDCICNDDAVIIPAENPPLASLLTSALLVFVVATSTCVKLASLDVEPVVFISTTLVVPSRYCDFFTASPRFTRSENATAATLAVSLPELASTVFDAICAILPNDTPLFLIDTNPSVVSKFALLKLATPLAACFSTAVPVGAAALVEASVIANLLCATAASDLTSALTILSATICTSTVFRVESTPVRSSKDISPTTEALIKLFCSPVNTRTSPASILLIVVPCILSNDRLCRFTASLGFTGSPRFIIRWYAEVLGFWKFISPFIGS